MDGGLKVMNVRIIDTSVLLNILNIPNRNQKHDEVTEEFKEVVNTDTLILPLAAIIETGNHISHINDGGVRREKAILFSRFLEKTAKGEAPWVYYGEELDAEDLNKIAEEFPENAMIGTGIGDMSIIRAYEKYKDSTPGIGRIMIWSLDGHLSGYEEMVSMKKRRKDR